MRTITVAVLVLSLATATLAASSPEVAVGGTATVNAPYGRWYPSVASNGDGFFAVWIDQRGYAFDSIVGTRISADGQILDPHGLVLGLGRTEPPQVVWDGSAYQVVWTQRSYTAQGQQPARIMGARVAADGRVVSAARVLKENAYTGNGNFAASNGNVTVVAYRNHFPGWPGDVRALVLDGGGNLIYDQTLVEDNSPRDDLTVATSGSDFLFAWTVSIGSDRFIEASSLDENGESLVRTPKLIGDGQTPRIASSGQQFLIMAQRVLGTPTWVGRIVVAELQNVSPTCALPNDRDVEDPSVVFRNGQYDFIAWDPEDMLVTARLDLAGCAATTTLRELHPVGTDLDNVFPSAATNGRVVLGAWTVWREIEGSGRSDIYARVYSGASQLDASTEPILLSRSGNSQRWPSIASGGTNHLVAWREPDYSIWAARTGADGQPLDGRGTRLSRLAYTEPRVAFDGRFYVVAWTEWGQLELRWIDPATGAVVAERTRFEDNGGNVGLAATPEATYLAWIGEEYDMRVLRIPNDTHDVAGPSVVVTPDTGRGHTDPMLSWNGSTLLAAWTEFETSRGDPPQIIRLRVLAARVTPELTLLDTPPLVVAGREDLVSGPPSVASNGADWLLVWDGGSAGIRARRLLHDGRFDEFTPTFLTHGLLPAVAWDGTRYALVWQDAWHNSTDYGQRALRLGTIPSAGPLGVTAGASIAAIDTYPSAAPSLARVGDGRVAVVYTRTSFAPEHGGVERAFLRFMETAAGPRKRRSAR